MKSYPLQQAEECRRQALLAERIPDSYPLFRPDYWLRETEEWERIARTPINPAARTAVYERAGVRNRVSRIGDCEECEGRHPLELHHIRRYRNVGRPKPYHETFVPLAGIEEPDDLLALCRDCHYDRHYDGDGVYRWDEEDMHQEWEENWFGHAFG